MQNSFLFSNIMSFNFHTLRLTLCQFLYSFGKVGSFQGFKILIYSGDNLLIRRKSLFPEPRSWGLEIKRSQKEPNQKNRLDEAKVWTLIHAIFSLKLRKCEPVRCLDEKGFFCAPISDVPFAIFRANGLEVLQKIPLWLFNPFANSQ